MIIRILLIDRPNKRHVGLLLLNEAWQYSRSTSHFEVNAEWGGTEPYQYEFPGLPVVQFIVPAHKCLTNMIHNRS
jgi:hypothetical protein